MGLTLFDPRDYLIIPMQSSTVASPAHVPHIPVIKLVSVILLFASMLLAITTSLHAPWAWLLTPLIFLAYLDASSKQHGVLHSLLKPDVYLFYPSLAVVALAFHFQGLEPTPSSPIIATSSCGSGMCGSSSGSSCGCGSGSARPNTAALPPAPTSRIVGPPTYPRPANSSARPPMSPGPVPQQAGSNGRAPSFPSTGAGSPSRPAAVSPMTLPQGNNQPPTATQGEQAPPTTSAPAPLPAPLSSPTPPSVSAPAAPSPAGSSSPKAANESSLPNPRAGK